MIKITNLSIFFIFLILLSAACKKSGPTEGPEQESIDSTGTAIDSYIADAKYLYIRGINADPTHPDYNNAELNNSAINKIFGYFKAVHALNSPQTDSIFNLYKVKIYHKYPLSSITLKALHSKPGIQNLIDGKIPTGNSALDNIFTKYGFNKATWTRYGESGSTSVTITTPKELNMHALYRLFKEREEFFYMGIPLWAGDGDRIGLTYRGETAILSFFKGEGDCPAGCTYWKSWVFEITDDVAVYKGKSTARPPDLFAATETPNDTETPFVGTPYAESPILGKWKLMKIQETMMGLKIYDYSGDNIIYEFNANGSFKVASNGKKYSWLNDGLHKFVLKEELNQVYPNQYAHTFRIGDAGLQYIAKITSDELELLRGHVDGADFFFSKTY